MAKALLWLNSLLSSVNVPYSWGFAIILFTVLIKVITLPLTLTQIKGMQAQRDLQPKLQELQKKYGKNREKLAQEQMKLYQEAGVNPLSGCLPLVIQMPVLFGLYSALVAIGPELADARFFWIPDLSFPHFSEGMGWISKAFTSGDYGTLVAYLILPAFLMITQVFMQRMTTAVTPTSGEGQAGMMNQMSIVMTLMFGFFTLQVPAGLTLYWVTSNILQLVQQSTVTGFNFTGKSGAPSGGGIGKMLSSVAGSGDAELPISENGAESSAEPSEDKTSKPKRSRRQRKRK
jgi:YidC/Oxa1 family membrane protein insertase